MYTYAFNGVPFSFWSKSMPFENNDFDEEENEREHPIGCITGIGRAIEIRLDLWQWHSI